MNLTKSEMEIMDVLWASEEPLARSDLLAKSTDKSWKDSSVHILLNGLLVKGAIIEAGVVKRSKTYGRIFSPSMTREEYFASSIYEHAHKPNLAKMFSAILDKAEPTKEELEAAIAVVQERLDGLGE